MIIHAVGKLAHLSLLCQPFFEVQGWCEGFPWHLMATVVLRDGRRAGPFVTIIDTTITELDTATNHTFERDFSFTSYDKFLSYSLLLDIHRVGEPSLTSLIPLPLDGRCGQIEVPAIRDRQQACCNSCGFSIGRVSPSTAKHQCRNGRPGGASTSSRRQRHRAKQASR